MSRFLGSAYIGSGVIVQDKDVDNFYAAIENVVSRINPFEVQIKNYGFMDNWPGGKRPGYTPYVIYLDIIVSPELLQLVDELEEKVTNGREKYYNLPLPYNPHITAAFQDLTEEGFLKAKELLEKRDFNGTTILNHVAIMRENMGKWSEHKRFPFGEKLFFPREQA